ncbi:hypothetical protein E5C31_03845 [Providencia rettgeri]|nr:hypothetical protein [Providencia rettgeri]
MSVVSEKVSIRDFEQAVFELEEIRIVVRGSLRAKVDAYEYERKAAGNTSVNDWLDSRIRPLIGEIEVSVINGNGGIPHGRTNLENVRSGYAGE